VEVQMIKRRIKRNPIMMVQTRTSLKNTSTWPWARGLVLRSKREGEYMDLQIISI
jgi:hypothetical protein